MKSDTKKRGLAPRTLLGEERRTALESLDRRSPAAAFVRAALDGSAPAAPVLEAPPPVERQLRQVPLAEIDLGNRRFQYRVARDLSALLESLLLQGQQIPVILRGADPPYQIVSGFGRCEALALAEKQGRVVQPRVWADLRPALTDREAHEISVIENEQREGLSELDRVSKAKRLKDESYTIAEICSVLKKRERMVQYYLSLADAPARIATALQDGRIKATHALVLSRFAREALAELTVPEVEAKIDEMVERIARGASVSEVRTSLSGTRRTPRFFVARGQSFELRSFHYSEDMPVETKRALLSALDEARERIVAGLKDKK